MNATPLSRRPLGCLKTSLRHVRQQKVLFSRSMATAVAAKAQQKPSPDALPDHNFFRLTDQKTKKLRSAFAVYTPPTALRGPPTPTSKNSKPDKVVPNAPIHGRVSGLVVVPSDPMPLLHAAQIKKMDPTGARTALFAKTRNAARVGDVLMVTHRRGGEPFAGVCLSIRRAGIDTAILLRNHLSKIGVEMWYKIYNRNVAGIEIIKRRARRARRARLTYMRQPKHDMGSVADLVHAWKKTRKVLTTRGAAKAGAKAAAAKAAAAAAKGKK
ncbi:translation protein SH3-like domain-containing protein [Lasiosphaeria hispida]|uniref:Translation protein SH3-like domain-containing protein n=1 Tax=Lasiosphaeria hispida TaxID=260671 RepID=A0AAJ0HL94_9PEZI|nr:translation protein SH3-like domain-containing protein [Lasiosphaeria hispida]